MSSEKEDGVCENKLCNDLDIKCGISSNLTQGIDSINVNNNNSTSGAAHSDSNCKDGVSKSSEEDDGVCCEVNYMLQSNDISVCANCGKGEEESVKLKSCTACKLVKYCSRDCQIAHRPQHKKECRKRAAELHDVELFKQPPPMEDCPICFLRMPILNTGHRYKTCCGKVICSGCARAPVYDDQGNKVDKDKQNECAFCRVVAPKSIEEAVKRLNKRVDVGDARAIYNQGYYYREGKYGFPQDYGKALERWHRAAELGEAEAYTSIGALYSNGDGVQVDKKKAMHYYELAAIKGDAYARYNLGLGEEDMGNMDRALKHYMIAVRGGESKSLNQIQRMYSNGNATKDDYTAALQSCQAYLDEIKSHQRDKAAAAGDGNRYISHSN